MKCSRCDDEIPANAIGVRCFGHCKGTYHMKCSGLSVRIFRAKSESEKKKWVCFACREKKLKNKVITCDSDESESSEEENLVVNLSLEAKIDALMKGQKETNDLILTFQNTVLKLEDEIKKRDEIINKIQQDLNEFQQHYRNNFIEIHNLPETKGESPDDLEKMLINVAATTGVNIDETEIEEIYRIPTSNKNLPKPIIAKLSKKKRNMIIAGRKNKDLTQDKIIHNGEREKVYVNESLTKFNKGLLYETKKNATDYKYIWTKEGRILAKKDDGSKPIQIRNFQDIFKLT